MRSIAVAMALTGTLVVAACQTSPPKSLSQTPPDDQFQRFQTIPAQDGDSTLTSSGFQRLSEADIKARVAGNTLRTGSTLNFYGSDGKVVLKAAALGGKLRSLGTWAVRNTNLCHSVSQGHEFCIALYFRGDELICWPGTDDPPTETGYLLPCEIIEGNRAS